MPPRNIISGYCLFLFIIITLKAEPKLYVLFHVTANRWGNTPLDEARMCGNKNLIKLLEDAKSAHLSEFPYGSQEFTGTDVQEV